MSLLLSYSMSFSFVPLEKTAKNANFFIISDFKHVFWYLGVLWQKVHFLKQIQFFETILLIPNLSCHNTPNRFFGIFITLSAINLENELLFQIFGCLDIIIEDLANFWWKFGGEFICQSWPLQTPFSQLSHSAVVGASGVSEWPLIWLRARTWPVGGARIRPALPPAALNSPESICSFFQAI